MAISQQSACKDDKTTRRRTLHYLLLLVLLVGQWLYATHSHEHEAEDDSDHPCPPCLRGLQFDAFVPAVPLKPTALAPRHIDSEHAHAESGEREDTHADITAVSRFTCAHPEALDRVEVRLFDHFPMTERLRLEYIA